VAKMPPQVGMVMLDLIVDSMDVPNRDEIVKRIRAITGQRDPDATEMTPEEMAQQQAAAQAQALQQADFEAGLREKLAKAAKAEAETDRIKAQTIGDKINATNVAMTAATSVVQMPTIAKVADALLGEAGWQGYNPAVQGLPMQPPAMPAPQPQQTAPNEMPPEMAQPAADGGAAPVMPA